MNMSMSMSTSMKMEASQKMSMRLTTEMRQGIILGQKLALIQVLALTRYSPAGKCPTCSCILTPVEILRGFNDDPTDYTTCCPKCNCRFKPILRYFFSDGQAELPFYCEVQLLDQLRKADLLSRPPKEISREHPAIYHSAIVHCGTLKVAFRKIKLDYQFDERKGWEEKIISFLGQMPDTIIADCVGASSSKIGRIRRKRKISVFKA